MSTGRQHIAQVRMYQILAYTFALAVIKRLLVMKVTHSLLKIIINIMQAARLFAGSF